ncbi:MAG: HD domain-containing protein [Thermoanaerobaculia bacterium]|nr:HD domain-containing protein [Thermoanaerobaculia bacterium]
MSSASERLAAQLDFVLEIDKLKQVLRRTLLLDQTRHENSAEHSWHLATMAILFHEYAPEPVDLLIVLKMLMVHDIVEIDAGDTYCYDEVAHEDKEERERQAADRLFQLLPSDLGLELRGLWEEFDARGSAEARFAAAMDRLQPLLHNYTNDGGTWLENDISREQVIERCCGIGDGAPELWDYALGLIEDATRRGLLRSAEDSYSSARSRKAG